MVQLEAGAKIGSPLSMLKLDSRSLASLGVLALSTPLRAPSVVQGCSLLLLLLLLLLLRRPTLVSSLLGCLSCLCFLDFSSLLCTFLFLVPVHVPASSRNHPIHPASSPARRCLSTAHSSRKTRTQRQTRRPHPPASYWALPRVSAHLRRATWGRLNACTITLGPIVLLLFALAPWTIRCSLLTTTSPHLSNVPAHAVAVAAVHYTQYTIQFNSIQ